jgi:hypothetical protein
MVLPRSASSLDQDTERVNEGRKSSITVESMSLELDCNMYKWVCTCWDDLGFLQSELLSSQLIDREISRYSLFSHCLDIL